ncbi:hypothetical protein [Streptomyces sp. NBC_01669]|uniref:hypothetical protein n=1 Tax=Streptomyces sp. NBC_01669 TaxID=2975909 RepID=UPI00224D467F|nr:hypothetical protein [Streptomyces sp. NBC_01669]MCX4531232.1 hypothetical protein [Streptomyces sp. NBC_01669]
MTIADLPIHNADLVVTMDETLGDLPGGWGARDLLGPVDRAVVGSAHAIDVAGACAVGHPRACATIARYRCC